LGAALELLVEVGYSGLTVEGIASRAGVGKATIYRRWASKLPLVIEAFAQLPALEESDTGDLVDDLERMLRSYLEAFVSTPLGAVVPGAAGRGGDGPRGGAAPHPVGMGGVRPRGAPPPPAAAPRARARRRARRGPRRHRSESRRRPDRRADHGATVLLAREADAEARA